MLSWIARLFFILAIVYLSEFFLALAFYVDVDVGTGGLNTLTKS